MAEDAVETARAHLVRVVAQTSVGDPAWTIGAAAAELIVMRLEALTEAKIAALGFAAPRETVQFPARLSATTIPDGFLKAETVEGRGQLPKGFRHDTYVEVIYRDGQVNKPAKSGMRPSVGEAALFNWRQTGSDDDVIGYRFVEPPENKMAMPKAVA